MPAERREEAAAAFISYLDKELASDGLIFRATLVPEDSALLALLRRHSAEFSSNPAVEERIMTQAPYIPLPATWDDYFRTLSGKKRWFLRRRLRSLQEEHHIEFSECTEDSLDDVLNTFVDLHQRRWQSVNIRGTFSNPKMKELYRDVARRFLARGWLHFSCLKVDGEIASAIYSYVYNGRFYAATAARDIRYSKYSIGHLHYMFLIEYAIKRDLQEFHFLQGEEPYKLRWTNSARRYSQVAAIRRGRCPGIRLKCMHVFIRAYAIKWYGLRESYHLRRIMKREDKERKMMGLDTRK
jgi:CelD/BcsL family acetyltransferase involved in cellulose biosynthesis